MTNVIPLRKRSISYYTVGKVAGGWAVVLATTRPRRALRERLKYFRTFEAAEAAAVDRAVRALLPFKAPRRARAAKKGNAA